MFRTKWPPDTIENSELEDITLQLFKKLDVEVDSLNIEDCHWLPNKGPKRVIEDSNRAWKVTENLKNMDLSLIGIRSPVYINDSLSKYYKMLW